MQLDEVAPIQEEDDGEEEVGIPIAEINRVNEEQQERLAQRNADLRRAEDQFIHLVDLRNRERR